MPRTQNTEKKEIYLQWDTDIHNKGEKGRVRKDTESSNDTNEFNLIDIYRTFQSITA